MKPLYLEFCGINSFSEPAKIDFSKLLAYGLFGIFGDTGSGKSTILDCIGFALYGDIARSRTGVIADVINYSKEEAYVIFEFELFYEGARRTFRIERKLKRKKDGAAEQSVAVFERTEGKYLSAAEGVRDANAFLRKVVGLEQRDFEKCIALPQGEFSQFVKASRGERLRIVARLFNLEKYGDSLVRRANAESQSLSEQTRVLAARLEPFADVTAEGNKELSSKIKALAAEEPVLEQSCIAARGEVTRLENLAEAKKEFDKVARETERLESQKEHMKKLNDELSRLFLAGEVIARSGELSVAAARADRANATVTELRNELLRLKEKQSALPAVDEEAAEREITRLEGELLRAEGAKAYREQAQSLAGRIIACERELSAKRAALTPFDYEKELAELGDELSRMPDEEFLALIESQGGLSRREYAAVREDFLYLQERHPEIGEDVAPILAKYAALAERNADLSRIKELFAARERAKKAAADARIAIEQRRERQNAAIAEIERRTAELGSMHSQAEELEKKLAGVPSLTGVQSALSSLRAEKKKREETKAATEKEIAAAALSLAGAEAKAEEAEEGRKRAVSQLSDALLRGGFSDADEARRLSAEYGDATQARARVEKYREDYAAARRRYRELSQTDYTGADEAALAVARAALAEAEEQHKQCMQTLATLRDRFERDTVRLEKKKETETLLRNVNKKAEIAERLKKLLKDNKFMEFVAEEYLQTVAYHASGRLLTLTDGRYFLRYDGGFYVGDNFNGGELRGVHTLSGGETFLVSLSLALSLSAEICARSARPIEFFFLDEGFGTLDRNLVDTVMDSLEKLRSERFSIGIISHVEELKQRIDRKLLVRKATQQHGSQIIMEL